MEKLKSFFEDGVEFVEIRNVDFYCKTDFWPFMPERTFYELEWNEKRIRHETDESFFIVQQHDFHCWLSIPLQR